MKEKIHPKLYEAEVICACGERFTAFSTKKEIRVELCSKCHPFFTGKQKLIDTGGRVNRFMKRLAMKDAVKGEIKEEVKDENKDETQV